jgi:hypothetical protein
VNFICFLCTKCKESSLDGEGDLNDESDVPGFKKDIESMMTDMKGEKLFTYHADFMMQSDDLGEKDKHGQGEHGNQSLRRKVSYYLSCGYISFMCIMMTQNFVLPICLFIT